MNRKLKDISQKKHKRLIVTGSSGFIAKQLITSLADLNFDIYCIDIETPVQLINKARVTEIGQYNGSLADAVEKITQDAKKDNYEVSEFFHLAGISEVQHCLLDPEGAYHSNVSLTFEALEACRRYKIDKFIFPSTALVYGKQQPAFAVNEETLPFPDTFYGWTKYIAEKAIESYSASFGIKGIVLRLSNIYGNAIKENTVWSDIYKQIKSGKSEVLVRDGNPIIDLIAIEDVVKAFVVLMNKEPKTGFEVFNVSSGMGISILELAELICKTNQLEYTKVVSLKTMEEDPPGLILDNRKLVEKGWRQLQELEQVIHHLNRRLS